MPVAGGFRGEAGRDGSLILDYLYITSFCIASYNTSIILVIASYNKFIILK